MNKQLLLIDFDGTLFNTDEFKIQLFNFVSFKYAINKETLHLTYEQYKNEIGIYDFFLHISSFIRIDFDELEKSITNHFLNKSSNFLFSDAITFLENNNKYHIVIYTLGDDRFQKLKFKVANILERIPRIIIQEDKFNYIIKNILYVDEFIILKSLGDSKYNEVVYVDDNPVFFKNPINKVSLCRIMRKGQKYNDKSTPVFVREITTLNTLI